MGEVLWLQPTVEGNLPPTSIFFTSGRFILSTFVLGSRDVFKRRDAYERCVDILVKRAMTSGTGDVRVKHSHLSAELIDTRFPPYSYLNPPKDLSLTSSFSEIFAEQEILHGSLEAADRIKLISQAIYGGEHLLTNLKKAWDMFVVEWQSQKINGTEPLAERISPTGDIYRLNLRAAKELGLDLKMVFDVCKRSAEFVSDDIADLETQLLSQVESLGIEPRHISPNPPHHSTSYRERVRPSYRLVHQSLIKELLSVQ